MLHTQLIALIEASGLIPDDALEVIRIFQCLNESKRGEVIANWSTISTKILLRREEIEKQKRALLTETLEKMNTYLQAYNKDDDLFNKNIAKI